MLAPSILSLWTIWAISTVVAIPGQTMPATCHTGNCLRAFAKQTRLPEASGFCSQYLSTSIDPIVVTAVEKTTVTATLANKTVTTDEATITTTELKAWTTTVTTGLDKREEIFPTFASRCPPNRDGDKAARVKSACSCLLVNTPPVTTTTTTQTFTAPAPVITPVALFVPQKIETVTVYTTTVWVYVGPRAGCTGIPCT